MQLFTLLKKVPSFFFPSLFTTIYGPVRGFRDKG